MLPTRERKKKAGFHGESPLQDSLLSNYLLGITGIGAGSGEEPADPTEPVEPQDVERAIPAAAAAIAIILTNFIVFIGFIFGLFEIVDLVLDLHAKRAHPSGLHASAARTKESDRGRSCSVNENFDGIHRLFI